MANKIKLQEDDINEYYEPSDSDGEYTERERKLLKKVRKKKSNDDSEEEVLAFDDSDSDTKDDKFEADSDIDGKDIDDGIPDSRAWGKKRKDYYSTDFVDQDYSSYTTREEQQAEQEESEARAIQQRLAKQLDEADFTLNVFATNKISEQDEVEEKTHLKIDLSDLSHRQKIQLFKKESPEFEGLVQDFEQRLEECEHVFEPILDYFKSKNITNLPILDFVLTKYNLTLTYCGNVAFYLVLKAKRISIKNHPLVKRLVQMRQLLLQLEDKYQTIIKPQLEHFLEDLRAGHELIINVDRNKSLKKTKKKQIKKLNFLNDMETKQHTEAIEGNLKEMSNEEEEEVTDDIEKDTKEKLRLDDDSENDEMDEENEMEETENLDDDDERRQITYQMAKNKGLTPHRKKELRNPRVKHRNKFRKALIRRKGAVRTVRTETKRYAGEVSGIKATTKKGIKIK